jgi:hypothetical protein
MRTDSGSRIRHAPQLLLLWGVSSALGVAWAEVATGIDEETGLKSWAWHTNGVSVQLVQRLPDQTRAFFMGRGFSAEAADIIGQACVFQTIFRNDSKQAVSYDLGKWEVIHQNNRLPLQVRETWDGRWQTLGVSQSARIAFRWSLLPTRQRFEPGDYNWGMTSFGLVPGERFDLALTIDHGGYPVNARILAVECANKPD